LALKIIMSQIFARRANDAEILQNVKFFCSANTLQKGMWRVWGEDRGVHRVLVGKPEGKEAVGETKT
jgi:hypothetical protein